MQILTPYACVYYSLYLRFSFLTDQQATVSIVLWTDIIDYLYFTRLAQIFSDKIKNGRYVLAITICLRGCVREGLLNYVYYVIDSVLVFMIC